MIHVKQAVNSASEHLVDLLGDDAVSDVRLEEVEVVKEGDWVVDVPDEARPEDADTWDKSYWLITISYLPKNPNPLLSERLQRQYKVFKLEAETGDLIAMKMRKVA